MAQAIPNDESFEPWSLPPLQGAFRRSRNRSQGAELAPRNPSFTPPSPLWWNNW